MLAMAVRLEAEGTSTATSQTVRFSPPLCKTHDLITHAEGGSYKNLRQSPHCALKVIVVQTFLKKLYSGQRAKLFLSIHILKHIKIKMKISNVARDLRHVFQKPHGYLHLTAPLCQGNMSCIFPQKVVGASSELWDPKLVPCHKHEKFLYIIHHSSKQ